MNPRRENTERLGNMTQRTRCSNQAWKIKMALGHVIRETQKSKNEGNERAIVEITQYGLSVREFKGGFNKALKKRFKNEKLSYLLFRGERQFGVVIFR